MFGKLGLHMRNHSNNEGKVAERKFMSVCPFGLNEFYCEDIIDYNSCNMLELKIVFRKYGIKSSMTFLKTGPGYKKPRRYTCVILPLTVEGLTSIL